MDFQAWGTLFTHWPTDWIIIGAFAIFAALDALRSGPARATALVLCLPAALLLVQQLPKALFVGPLAAQFSTPLAQAALFAVIVIVLYVVAHRLIFRLSDSGGPAQALVAGLATAIVLLVVWLLVPGLDSIWHFGDQVQMVFGEAYRFWWLLGSYIALAAVRS